MRNYQVIGLLDPQNQSMYLKTIQIFIQGFVDRCLKTSASEILKIDYQNDIGIHKYITPSVLDKYELKKQIAFNKEHVADKKIYFKDLIEELKKDNPDEEQIFHLLLKYYFTALITNEEEKNS